MKGFPEDYHSGAYGQVDDGDPNDAASFGAHNYTALPISAVIEGCTFSNPDYSNNQVDIDPGIVRLVGSNINGANNTSWKKVSFVYETDSFVDVELSADTVNHLYIKGDISNNNTAEAVVNTTGTAPSGPVVKLGTVDTASNTTSEQWYLLRPDGTFSFPSESAALEETNVFPDGTMVYDRSTNTQYFVNGDGLSVAATQSWVNSNADVPNADHANSADNADQVDGNDFSDIQNWVNDNADVPNADYADSAGDADTVDGLHADEIGVEDHSELTGIGDNDHHTRPTSTQPTQNPGGWWGHFSSDSTYTIGNVLADGLQFHTNSTNNNKVVITWDDGSTTDYGGSDSTAGLETINFTQEVVTEVDVWGGVDWASLHRVSTGSHSHDI